MVVGVSAGVGLGGGVEAFVAVGVGAGLITSVRGIVADGADVASGAGVAQGPLAVCTSNRINTAVTIT